MGRSPLRKVVARIAALTVALGAAASGQAPPQPPFKTDASAVMVDVVVRDRKGNPVTDLTAADFELLEDGVRQQIADVSVVATPGRSVTGAPDAAAGGGVPAAPGGVKTAIAIPPPTFTALVMGRLSPEARALAYQGGLACVNAASGANDFVGVFLADLSLVTLQPYTNDRRRLRAAVERAASTPTAASSSAATRDPLAATGSDPEAATRLTGSGTAGGDARASVPIVASAESPGRTFMMTSTVKERRLSADEAVMEAMLAETRTHAAWDGLTRDRDGYAATNALLAVTAGLSALPGRKTIVLFAEGLAIPDRVLPEFRNVVAAANRANVTIYTVDASGLRVHSTDAESGREVRAMGDAGLQVNPDGSNSSTLAMMERNEDVLRKNPRTGLTMLAEQTGGFLVDDTNDLGRAFRTIDQDRQSYYLLTYMPRNPTFTGEWRSLTVRVPNRKVQVRARSGYVAVRSAGVLPLLAYEAPALALFGRVPPPADIPVRVGSFTFPAGGTDSIVALLVDVEAQHVAFEVTDQGYRTDFTILAQLRDVNGEVVRKGSFHYRLRGTPEQVEGARAGHVLFYRQPTVPAGRYSLEVAVLDSFGRRATVQRMPIEVPGAGLDDPAVGSLVVVRSTEPVAPGESRGNPLVVDGVLAYPSLGDPVSLGAGALTLLFSVTPKPGEDLSVELEVLQDDVAVAAGPVDLRPPGEDGHIRQFASVPAATLLTGECLVRLTVSHGDRRTVRTAAVRLVE